MPRIEPGPELVTLCGRIAVGHNLAEDAAGERSWLDLPAEDLAGVIRLAAAASLLAAGAARDGVEYEVGVLFGSDEEIARLNGVWRDKPKPTNVLSWPGEDIAPGEPAPAYVGDLAFAEGTVIREAKDHCLSPSDYLAVLTIHGVTHCLGHDHIDDGEAEAMEALESQACALLGLPDPYSDTEPA